MEQVEPETQEPEVSGLEPRGGVQRLSSVRPLEREAWGGDTVALRGAGSPLPPLLQPGGLQKPFPWLPWEIHSSH